MRSDVVAVVDWLRSSGHIEYVYYGRLLREVTQTLLVRPTRPCLAAT
jgi:hypothetical protein